MLVLNACAADLDRQGNECGIICCSVCGVKDDGIDGIANMRQLFDVWQTLSGWLLKAWDQGFVMVYVLGMTGGLSLFAVLDLWAHRSIRRLSLPSTSPVSSTLHDKSAAIGAFRHIVAIRASVTSLALAGTAIVMASSGFTITHTWSLEHILLVVVLICAGLLAVVVPVALFVYLYHRRYL